MIVIRFVVFLVLITIGLSLAMFLLTKNRRYLTFAWQVLRLSVIFLLVAATLFILERLVLVA